MQSQLVLARLCYGNSSINELTEAKVTIEGEKNGTAIVRVLCDRIMIKSIIRRLFVLQINQLLSKITFEM